MVIMRAARITVDAGCAAGVCAEACEAAAIAAAAMTFLIIDW
jgi:hypothetical protein